MPQFATKHFGAVEYQPESVFEFPAGLPGFEQETRFLPIEQPSSYPVVFLQSLNRPELCFITLPVRVVDPNYRPAIAAEDLQALGVAQDRQPEIGREVLCLAIVSVAEDRAPTANLLAPVVVNLKTRRGVQAIQTGSGYLQQQSLMGLSGG